MILSDFEHTILKTIQNGMPMSRSPYQDLSKTIGIPVEKLLAVLRQWQTDGRLRRLGAVVNHFQVGFAAGAMVVWCVPDDRVDAVGELFASFPKISHVYLRASGKQWPYNLYTMVHASGGSELETTIETMSRQSRITDFRVLKTVKELKKVPPTYIFEQ
jgi:DNA-binding Lrp family transcriptional regulator